MKFFLPVKGKEIIYDMFKSEVCRTSTEMKMMMRTNKLGDCNSNSVKSHVHSTKYVGHMEILRTNEPNMSI